MGFYRALAAPPKTLRWERLTSPHGVYQCDSTTLGGTQCQRKATWTGTDGAHTVDLCGSHYRKAMQ